MNNNNVKAPEQTIPKEIYDRVYAKFGAPAFKGGGIPAHEDPESMSYQDSIICGRRDACQICNLGQETSDVPVVTCYASCLYNDGRNVTCCGKWWHAKCIKLIVAPTGEWLCKYCGGVYLEETTGQNNTTVQGVELSSQSDDESVEEDGELEEMEVDIIDDETPGKMDDVPDDSDNDSDKDDDSDTGDRRSDSDFVDDEPKSIKTRSTGKASRSTQRRAAKKSATTKTTRRGTKAGKARKDEFDFDLEEDEDAKPPARRPWVVRRAGAPPASAKQQFDSEVAKKVGALKTPFEVLFNQSTPLSRRTGHNPNNHDPNQAATEKTYPVTMFGLFYLTNQVPNSAGPAAHQVRAKPKIVFHVGPSKFNATHLHDFFYDRMMGSAEENFEMSITTQFKKYIQSMKAKQKKD